MDKVLKYELMYVKLSWFFTVMGGLYIAIGTMLQGPSNIVFWIAVMLFCCSLNFIKYRVIKTGAIQKNLTYGFFKGLEVLFFSIAINCSNLGKLGYVLIVFSVLLTSLCKGTKFGLGVVAFSFVANLATIFLWNAFALGKGVNLSLQAFSTELLQIVFYYLSLVLFAVLCGMIYRNSKASEEENKQLLEQLVEKYKQLAAAQDEVKVHYEKLKDTNCMLEDTNKKLTSSIAEFYTLQQISQAISSILDIKELLKFVNDIILGVMGVNYSTIVLYDEKRSKLKVQTTNVKNRDELIVLNDHINCQILLDALNNGKPLLENFVDPDEYVFAHGREVNSLICVPLITKSRKFGLVLIEHKYYSAFDEENVRLLETIGLQVGIVMENAELYQKMQELATIDGLTGVYNRLYFQERLEKEFRLAQEENYNLSIAIFDIDHFKKFNDTFGHLFGDKVLKSISHVVKSSLRSTDILARFGGEEFAILFPRTNLSEAFEKVEALRRKISQNQVKDNLVTVSVTVSFGIACFPESSSIGESELIRDADDALYEAKGSGRNCARVAKIPQ